MSNLPKVHCGMKDKEAIDYCKNPKKMYSKEDIVNLATRCGIEDAHKKNRNDLCDLIAKQVNNGESAMFDVHTKAANCTKYQKKEIIALAEKCKVDTTGTNEQICARIAKSILSLPATHSNSSTPSASSSSSGTPIGTPPIGTPPESKCIMKHPPNPPCLEKMRTLPSVEDLMTYNKDVLKQMCDIKGIKYSTKYNKLQLAQALFSCTCNDGTPSSPTPSSSTPSSSTPSSPTPSSPTPSPTPPKTSGTLSNCVASLTSGKSKEKAERLKELFDELNLKGMPKKQSDQAEYICASKQNKKCKAPNWDCEGDLVCDISTKNFPNGEGVCLPKKFAESREPHKTYVLPSGTKIIGMPSVINELKREIEKNAKLSSQTSKTSSSTHNRPPTTIPPVSHKPQTGSSLYNTPCYAGLTYEQLNKMTIQELIAKFFGTTGSKINISVNSWTKGEIIAYLCAKGQQNYCNAPDWTCEGDYVCDASTNPGICVRPDFAEKQLQRKTQGKTKYDHMFLGGRKIIGKPEIIKLLKDQLQQSTRSPSQPDHPIHQHSSGSPPQLFQYGSNGKTLYGPKDAIAQFIQTVEPAGDMPLTPLVSEKSEGEHVLAKPKKPEPTTPLTPLVSEKSKVEHVLAKPKKPEPEPEPTKPLTPLVSEKSKVEHVLAKPKKPELEPEPTTPLTPLVSEKSKVESVIPKPKKPKIVKPPVKVSAKPKEPEPVGTPPPIVKDPETPDYTPPTTPPLPIKKPEDGTPISIPKKKAKVADLEKPEHVTKGELSHILAEIQEEEEEGNDIKYQEKIAKRLAECLGLSTSR
jgi:hypothetical protein